MNCRKVSHLLSAYIDGELPGVEHRLIHDHLGQCPECSEEHRALLQTKRMLARLRVQEPRPDLPSLILSRVAQEQTPPAFWSSGWFSSLWKPFFTSRPANRALTIGLGLAAVGLYFVNGRLARQDTIRWYSADATRAALLESAPALPDSVAARQLGAYEHVAGPPQLLPSGMSVGTAARDSSSLLPAGLDPAPGIYSGTMLAPRWVRRVLRNLASPR